MSLKIINMRTATIHEKMSAVRVDRRTKWGNPYIMHGEKDRDQVCDLYREYALEKIAMNPQWLELLRGKNLACWCAPKRCHAETLMELANA